MNEHGLGRVEVRDIRTWPMRRLAAMIEAGLAVPVCWKVSALLDQDDPVQTGHCVGFAGAGWEATDSSVGPGAPGITNARGHELYYLSVIEGGLPNSEGGSTGLWLAKALQRLGIIDHYAIGGFDEGKIWLSKYGSVPIGTNWWTSMDKPGPDGLVTIGGSIRGGHETIWHQTNQAIYDNGIRNSWGRWGYQLSGDYRATDDTLRTLIDGQGGDCLFMVKLVTPTPPPEPPPFPTPPPTPAPLVLARSLHLATPHLKGPDVKLLQQRLLAKGYDLGKWKDDGDFGNATRAAVLAFQRATWPNDSLAWTGVVDPAWDLLNK